MAPKSVVKKPPPAVSSSEDESSDSETVNHHEQDEQEEEEEESDNDAPTEDAAKFPEMISKPESESEADSDTDSDDSNTSPSAAGFTIEPVASRPVEEPQTKKRKVSASASNGGAAAEEPKSPAFQRLWSEEDEIAILKGMSDFKAEKGVDAYTDMVRFHNFIKGSLGFEPTKTQLMSKIRRLKKKFLTDAERDEAAVSSKPHELKSFELSKKIWGTSGANPKKTTSSVIKKESSAVKKESSKSNKEEFLGKYPWLSESLSLVNGSLDSQGLARTLKESMGLIGDSKAKELEKKWKKLRTEEIELQIKRSEMAVETYKLVLESVKSSKH